MSIEVYESESLSVSYVEGLAEIVLKREATLNALSSGFLEELTTSWSALEAIDGVRVVKIRSTHAKAFIAGADITEMQDKSGIEMAHYAAIGHQFMAQIETSHLVSVAVVNGYCLGGGFEVTLACDLIVAGGGALLGFPDRFGADSWIWGTQQFTKSVGVHSAMKYMLTGDKFGADMAEKLGFIWHRLESDSFDDDVQKLVIKLSKQAPNSMAAIKKMARTALSTDINTGCQAEINAFGLIAGTADAAEGLSAFIDKRTAEFTGK